MNARLKKIVTDFRRGMLGRRRSRGMCWLISKPLAGYLQFLGHACTVIEGVIGDDLPADCHVWIELADGTCIDATADQFSTKRRPMPKVYIGPRPAWYRAITHAELTAEVRRQERIREQAKIERRINRAARKHEDRKTRRRAKA